MGELKELAAQVADKVNVTAKEFLTVEEAAQYAGLKRSYLYKLMMSREIPYYKPRGKMCYFDRSELNEWIRRGRVATNAETEDINRVELRGHVGSVSLFGTPPAGGTNISLSTAIPYNDSEYEVTWHRVAVFQNMCEVDVREIKPGDYLHITGRIRIEKYTGADGTESCVCKIIASGCRKCEE